MQQARQRPMRRCMAEARSVDTGSLIRFVVDPEGLIVPDLQGKLPGRGIWVSSQQHAMRRAIAKRLFHRGARREVNVPADLIEQVERLLAQRCGDLIGLARRAGEAVCGLERTRSWLLEGNVGVLLGASDGAPAALARLRAMAADAPSLEVLTADELGAAFGRDRVVHAVIGVGRLAEKLMNEGKRLAGFRPNAGRMTSDNSRGTIGFSTEAQ